MQNLSLCRIRQRLVTRKLTHYLRILRVIGKGTILWDAIRLPKLAFMVQAPQLLHQQGVTAW